MHPHPVKLSTAIPLFVVVFLLVLIFVQCTDSPDQQVQPAVWSVEDLASAEVNEEVRVTGLLFDDGDGLVLCGALAESFPPQCPGTSMPIANADAVEAEFTTSQGVRWTDAPVTLYADVVDGELVVDP